jgi:anti-sigma factor RsiW
MARLSEEDRENLVAYLDGELDEDTARALETKLSLNPAARAEAEAFRQAWSMLDYLPRSDPSPTFTHRTLERLALQTQMVRHRGRSWLAGLGWVAALILAALAGFGAARLIWPDPREPADLDEYLVRHLPIAEKLHLLEQAVDVEFLRELDHPDLFGDDPGS